MIASKQQQRARRSVVRYFFDYPDFRVRVDDNSPAHYEFEVRKVDSDGMKWILMFRVFALDRRDQLIIFEHRWLHSYLQSPARESVMHALVEEFADPLNAIPGRIEVK